MTGENRLGENNNHITIIEAPKTVDWPQLYALLHKAYAFMEGRIDPPSSLHKMNLNILQQKARDEILMIAQEKRPDGIENIVGCLFARVEQEALYLGKVAVSPQNQGQGICRKMFAQARECAKRQKLEFLQLETRIELVENHQTFARLGFVKIAETAHKEYSKPTAITMQAKV